MRGPIDYIIVGFEGGKFDGNILRALETAIDKGIINLLALKIISVNAEGIATEANITSDEKDYIMEFSTKYKIDSKQVTREDIDEVAELLQNNTTAGLLIIEQLWAKPLKKALLDANGVLVAEGRVHPEAAEEFNRVKELSHAGST